MEDIMLSMEDLIQQGLADIHIQIQALKLKQNKSGNNKNLFNISQQKFEQLCKQKEQVFEDIIDLVYDFSDTYEYLYRSISTHCHCDC